MDGGSLNGICTKLYCRNDHRRSADMFNAELFDTDYVIIKIAEGVSTKEEYADIIRQRQIWRDEINQLESADD